MACQGDQRGEEEDVARHMVMDEWGSFMEESLREAVSFTIATKRPRSVATNPGQTEDMCGGNSIERVWSFRRAVLSRAGRSYGIHLFLRHTL